MPLFPAKARPRFGRFDLAVILAFLAGCGFLLYRVEVVMDYHWNWPAIPRYLLRYDAETGSWVPNLLLTGLWTTLRLSFWSMLPAILLGTLFGVFRASPRLFRRLLGQGYVGMIRNLPPLVLILIGYFFLSSQLLPLLGLDQLLRDASPGLRNLLALLFAPPERLPEFLSAVLTLALLEGAYITEIVRSGIESVGIGQWEGAAALGLTRRQQLRLVILPQALRLILPPLAGQFISTIKDSAIVSVISIPELTFQGLEIMAASYLTLEIWISVALLYFLLTFSCSLLFGRAEAGLQRRFGGTG